MNAHHVNMLLSPPAFEAICEIGTFTAASLHIERLQITAPACLLYKQYANVNVHVRAWCALHTPLCACNMRHVHAPRKSLYRNPIHRSNQHGEVVMHILILPHTSLTLHICICNDRCCERDVRTLYSDFRLQCQCILL